ncbi:hypothetical protein KW799_02615 [Candidatus Parcubacteria bacterium]|nr:hypothetical protein [Candidatus Parcubacteria bacterium]
MNSSKIALLGLLKATVSPLQRQRLERIDSEDFSAVRKKAREILKSMGIEASEEYLDLGILGLKQYYALPVLNPKNGHAVSAEIDPFWHAHMLFTRQFARFGQDVIGGPMHHIPLDHDHAGQLENVRTLYGYTLGILKELFGEDGLDPRVWPRSVVDARLMCIMYDGVATPPDLDEHALFPFAEAGRVWAFA